MVSSYMHCKICGMSFSIRDQSVFTPLCCDCFESEYWDLEGEVPTCECCETNLAECFCDYCGGVYCCHCFDDELEICNKCLCWGFDLADEDDEE